MPMHVIVEILILGGPSISYRWKSFHLYFFWMYFLSLISFKIMVNIVVHSIEFICAQEMLRCTFTYPPIIFNIECPHCRLWSSWFVEKNVHLKDSQPRGHMSYIILTWQRVSLGAHYFMHDHVQCGPIYGLGDVIIGAHYSFEPKNRNRNRK